MKDGNVESPIYEFRQDVRVPADNAYGVAYEQIAYAGFGDICDISLSGMQIKTIDCVEPGAIKLQFKLPHFQRKETVRGAIVWIDEKRFLYGVRFNYVNQRLKESIENYLLHQLT